MTTPQVRNEPSAEVLAANKRLDAALAKMRNPYGPRQWIGTSPEQAMIEAIEALAALARARSA